MKMKKPIWCGTIPNGWHECCYGGTVELMYEGLKVEGEVEGWKVEG
jgi:hypothetical protein